MKLSDGTLPTFETDQELSSTPGQSFSLKLALDCNPLKVSPSQSLQEIATLMSQGPSCHLRPQSQNSGLSQPQNCSSSYALVTVEDQLVGILTERDIVKLSAKGIDIAALTAEDIMTKKIIVLQENDLRDAFSALNVFRQYRIRHLPILNERGIVVGVATPNSIRRILQFSDLFKLRLVHEVMSTQVVTASLDTFVLELSQLMAERRVSCVVILERSDTSHLPAGIVTERDIVKFQASGLELSSLKARSVMSSPLQCLSPKDSLWTAHQTMERLHVRRLVVTDEQRNLVGLVTQTSILSALDPLDMQKTISVLQKQVDQLQDERLQLLQDRASKLETEVKTSEERFSAIFNQAFQFINLLEPDGTVIETNQTGLVFGGLERKDVIGKRLWEARWWVGLPEIQAQLKQAVARAAQGEFIRYEVDILGADRVATIDFSLRPMLDETGQIQLLIAEGRDMSDRKLAEAALSQSEQSFENLAKVAPVGIFKTDAEGHCLYVNERWCKIAGMTKEDAAGSGWVQGIVAEDQEHIKHEWYESTKEKRIFRLEFRFQSSPDKVTWVLGQSVAEEGPDGQICGYIGTIADITERKEAELKLKQLNQELESRVEQRTAELKSSQERLFREKELAQVTLHSIGDAVITTDKLGTIEYFNTVAEQLTGWKSTDAVGQPLFEVFQIVDEFSRKRIKHPIEFALRGDDVDKSDNHPVLIAKNGKEYSIEDSVAPIQNRDGHVLGVVIVFHDVTQARQTARELSWQASHDVLTGLANRRQFEHELSLVLQAEKTHGNERDRSSHIVCYLDLDQFKIVNDTCGHLAGDELLLQVSEIFKAKLRHSDVLARLGGDEFGILLKDCPLEQAKKIANALREAIRNYRFSWESNTFSIGVSIGLAPVNGENTLVQALSAADAACYAAKNRGRNRVYVLQANDTELLKQKGEQQWNMRIKQAIEDDRFCLYQQAISNATTSTNQEQFHYEILVRMIGEQGELIAPGAFIPAAERYGLMQEIDRWVIKTFFAHVQHSIEQPSSSTTVDPQTLYFINLSGMSLGDHQFLEFLKQQFTRYDVSPESIVFELTETAAISNLNQATHFMRELSQLGCRFALDDFGSGMSSFGYLKALPVDFLKIDGNFVREIVSDSTTYAIVESINHIGHVLGLKTIAEFVENQTIREQSAKIGVDFVQGYGIDKPSPVAIV